MEEKPSVLILRVQLQDCYMNRAIVFFLLSVIIFVLGCGKEKLPRTTDPVFQQFLNDIPKQPIPLYLRCGLPDQSAPCSNYKNYKSYIPKSVDRLFGQIDSKNDLYKLIIYGYSGNDINPILFSFDNRGEIIDSLRLFLEGCGSRPGEKEISNSSVYFHDYLAIQQIDTTKLVHYPEFGVGEYIVDSLRMTRQTYVLTDEGKIVVATFTSPNQTLK